MPYRAIIEMGPIVDALYSTRKAKDLWGASFLFAYLMGRIAQTLQHHQVTIERPSLQKDTLFLAIQRLNSGNWHTVFKSVDAGTIPDRLYVSFAGNPEDIFQQAQTTMHTALWELFQKAKSHLQAYHQDDFKDCHFDDVAQQQLRDYFRLFMVWDNAAEFDTLEKAATSRSHIFEITQTADSTNSVDNKYKRCQLCGDRKRVIILKNVRAGKKRPDEPLCAVCTLKRSLYGLFKPEQAFPSTTRVAATIVNQALAENFTTIQSPLNKFLVAQKTETDLRKNLIDEIGKKKYEEFQDNIHKGWTPASYDAAKPFIDFRNVFSEHDASKELRAALKKTIEENGKTANTSEAISHYKTQLVWYNRPFYAMVALDGDRMGGILRELATDNNHSQYQMLSEKLSEFSNSLADKIPKRGGILFYAGGDDALFMIHPAYLMDSVLEIAQHFRNLMQQALPDLAQDQLPTISAGAYICFHKHPLKLAIQGAYYQLFDVAKKEPGKNALAIQLHKGGGERANIVIKIMPDGFHIQDAQQFISQIFQGTLQIPRGLVYKLMEEAPVFKNLISSSADLERYVSFYYEKSRQTGSQLPVPLQQLLNMSYKGAGDYSPLLNHLYFLRFLTGEGA